MGLPRPNRADVVFVVLAILWSAFWLYGLSRVSENEDVDQLFDGLAVLGFWLIPLVIGFAIYAVIRLARETR